MSAPTVVESFCCLGQQMPLTMLCISWAAVKLEKRLSGWYSTSATGSTISRSTLWSASTSLGLTQAAGLHSLPRHKAARMHHWFAAGWLPWLLESHKQSSVRRNIDFSCTSMILASAFVVIVDCETATWLWPFASGQVWAFDWPTRRRREAIASCGLVRSFKQGSKAHRVLTWLPLPSKRLSTNFAQPLKNMLDATWCQRRPFYPMWASSIMSPALLSSSGLLCLILWSHSHHCRQLRAQELLLDETVAACYRLDACLSSRRRVLHPEMLPGGHVPGEGHAGGYRHRCLTLGHWRLHHHQQHCDGLLWGLHQSWRREQLAHLCRRKFCTAGCRSIGHIGGLENVAQILEETRSVAEDSQRQHWNPHPVDQAEAKTSIPWPFGDRKRVGPWVRNSNIQTTAVSTHSGACQWLGRHLE